MIEIVPCGGEFPRIWPIARAHLVPGYGPDVTFPYETKQCIWPSSPKEKISWLKGKTRQRHIEQLSREKKKKWPAIRFHRMSSGYGEFQDKVVSRPNGSVSSRNLPWRRAYLKNSHQCYLFPALVRRWHKIDSFARWKEETPTISMQSAIHLRSSPGWIATKKLAPRIQEFCDIMALHRGARYYGKLRRFCASFKTLRGENLVPSHNCT